jgi:hypothetical protein
MRAPNPEIYAPGVALGGAPLGGQVAGNRDEYLGLIDGLLDVQSLGGAAALRVHNVSCRVRAALAPRPPPTPRHALRRPAPAPAPVPAPAAERRGTRMQVEARAAYMGAGAADEVKRASPRAAARAAAARRGRRRGAAGGAAGDRRCGAVRARLVFEGVEARRCAPR